MRSDLIANQFRTFHFPFLAILEFYRMCVLDLYQAGKTHNLQTKYILLTMGGIFHLKMT